MIKMSHKAHSPIRVFTLLLLITALFSFSKAFAQPDGKKLFKANCSSCHSITDQKLVGPGLKGVQSRWPDKDKLYAWVKNSPEFLKTGDAYANQLFEQYNKSPMTPFPDLSNEQIDAILKYVEEGDKKGPIPGPTPTPGPTSDAEPNNTLTYVLLGLALLLVILVVVLKGVKKSLNKVVNEKNGLPEEAELGTAESIKKWISKNKAIVIIVVILLVIGGLKDIWNGLLSIGVYEGYAPEQPIKFSHKIHAGDNKINCVYCHSGAEKSRNAGIPAAMVCMNCHKGIQQGSVTGDTEIKKIYAALDYDPATQTYGNNPKPIKWVKVHNLPDLAYFNHSQHVVVGGVACQTCHGEVEKMDVLSQHSPLTMGWCVDCHRKTEVKMEGSEYYQEIHNRLSDDLKKKFKEDGKITVDELGGIECAKCHY